MPFHSVCTLGQLPPGGLTEVTVGERLIALCNVQGSVHAIDGLCPHRGGFLGQGALHQNMVVCPWHAWEFDCTTGAHDYNPAIQIATYSVKIEGDDILVEVP